MPDMPCCAQVLLRNTLPDYWDAISLRILSGNAVFDGFPHHGEWTVDVAPSGTEALARPLNGSIPVCTNETFFAMCFNGPDQTDILIGMEWISKDSLGCLDTLLWRCGMIQSTDDETERGEISTFRILGYAPDPIRDHGTLAFSVDRAMRVRIELYDLLGRMRATMFDAHCDGGIHTIGISTAGLTSGTYIVRMSSGTRSTARVCRIVR
jgi:hypothetical protein